MPFDDEFGIAQAQVIALDFETCSHEGNCLTSLIVQRKCIKRAA